jgi:hypothetical protein
MLSLSPPSRTLRLRDAIRWVFFETEQEGWEYAWHGGTLLVVEFRGVPYGITAKHNRHDFSWQQLCVTNQRVGWRPVSKGFTRARSSRALISTPT